MHLNMVYIAYVTLQQYFQSMNNLKHYPTQTDRQATWCEATFYKQCVGPMYVFVFNKSHQLQRGGLILK